MTSMTLSNDPNQHQPQHTYIHHYHPHPMNPIHCHNKPRSVSPSRYSQCDIGTRDSRRDSSGSNAMINNPNIPTSITTTHTLRIQSTAIINKGLVLPKRRDKGKIVYGDPSCDNYGSDAKIKYQHNNSCSKNNGHYCEGHFQCSHSICK